MERVQILEGNLRRSEWLRGVIGQHRVWISTTGHPAIFKSGPLTTSAYDGPESHWTEVLLRHHITASMQGFGTDEDERRNPRSLCVDIMRGDVDQASMFR